MKSQEKIWNAIASDWHEFKTVPARHVKAFLKEREGNVIDHGSGSGRHLKKIKKGKMFLVDFSEQMIELAKKKAKEKKINAEFAVADLTELPYEDGFFDAGISISSIHCLEKKEHKKVVKELYRVLKPGAQVMIGVWNKESKRFKNAPKEKLIGWRDKGKRYYYLFDEKEIHDLFKGAGFKIKKKLNSEMMINFVVGK